LLSLTLYTSLSLSLTMILFIDARLAARSRKAISALN